jgi:MFS family permease
VTSSLAPSFAPFRHRPFATYWLARALWTLATQVQVTAMGWQIYDIARDRGDTIEQGAFLLGLIGLFQFVPLLLLSPIGGQTADRRDRRAIILIGLVVKVALAAALVATAGAAPDTQVAAILAVAAATGLLNAFLPAASSAMVPNLLPREVLPQGIALMSLGFTTASIVGPAIGGLLYQAGPAAPYCATAAGLAAAVVLVLATATPPQQRLESGRTYAQILEGLRYMRDNPIVLGAMSLDLAVVFLAGASALLPVFARDILHAGPEALGLLRAATAAGAAVVAMALAVRPITRHVGAWMFAAVAVFGLATIGFGLSRLVWVSVLCLVIAGAADMVSVYVRSSLIQLATPDAMRGRVAASSFVFVSASNELGDFQSGVAARFLGPVTAVVAGGLGALAVAGLWMRLFPELARADRIDPADEHGSAHKPLHDTSGEK